MDTILGNSEQGQLGRVPEKFGHRGGRRGGQLLLQPDKIHSKSRSRKFKDVWAGSYNTVALTTAGEVLTRPIMLSRHSTHHVSCSDAGDGTQ